MNTVKTLCFALTALSLPFIASAESAVTEARSPGDMSVEERTTMMKTASLYDNCIYSQAIAKVGEFADIRQAADFAMGECQSKLTDLESTITGMGFGADYATAFAHRIRNRAARKILPELAVRKAGG
ncbi:MAG: hypothetical protein ACU85U_21105 [Gammaproteobacteria bacterium]|jgi:hypothetical protein